MKKLIANVKYYFKYDFDLFLLMIPATGIAGIFLLCFAGHLISDSFTDLRTDRETEQAQWQVFQTTNNCQVIEKKQAIFPAVAQVAWACDDGITYWRNDQ